MFSFLKMTVLLNVFLKNDLNPLNLLPLTSDGTYTIFAPTNDAFLKHRNELLNPNAPNFAATLAGENLHKAHKIILCLGQRSLKTLGRVGSVFLRIETSIIKTPTKKNPGISVKKSRVVRFRLVG